MANEQDRQNANSSSSRSTGSQTDHSSTTGGTSSRTTPSGTRSYDPTPPYTPPSYVAPPNSTRQNVTPPYTPPPSLTPPKKNSGSADTIKILAIIVPVLAFLIGQIMQYVAYERTGNVLIASGFFKNIHIVFLIFSSLLAFIDTIFIAIAAYRFADEGEDDEIYYSAFYFVFNSIGFIMCPFVCSFIVAIPATVLVINECDDVSYVPFVTILPAFFMGQIIQWSRYLNTGEVFIISALEKGPVVEHTTTRLVIASVLSLIASILYIWIISASNSFKKDVSMSMIVCSATILVLLFAPAAGSLIRLLVAFFALVVGSVKDEDELPFVVLIYSSIIEFILVSAGMIVSSFL